MTRNRNRWSARFDLGDGRWVRTLSDEDGKLVAEQFGVDPKRLPRRDNSR